MEPESSSPYPQVPATRPYPEPTPSRPTTPSNFLKIHLNIILPSTSQARTSSKKELLHLTVFALCSGLKMVAAVTLSTRHPLRETECVYC